MMRLLLIAIYILEEVLCCAWKPCPVIETRSANMQEFLQCIFGTWKDPRLRARF
jgi:hypothetical protein